MSFYRVEDTASVDAFSPPSIFDKRLRSYQEWHDFVFYDRKRRIFGLLNFGIHSNIYDSKRGWGSVLSYIVDPKDKIFSEIKLIPIDKLEFSHYTPNFIGDAFKVNYLKDNSFEVKGQMEKVSFDLSFGVVSPPVSNKDIFLNVMQKQGPNAKMFLAAQEMGRQWDNWVELPRLTVAGKLKLGKTIFQIKTNQGYQDHEGGCFDMGKTWGWDTGVVLCDPSAAQEPKRVDFLFYRYGPSDNFSYGGIFFENKNGEEKYFDSRRIQVSTKGKYTGSQTVMPAITKLLYPDYHPAIAKNTTFIVANGSDKLEITFSPKAVCSIINASLYSPSEAVFNEMFCEANLRGHVGGQTYDCTLPCWFESVRPRKRVDNYATNP